MPEGISIVSSFFLIIFPHKVYSFADGAVVKNFKPVEQLADIAITTAENHRNLQAKNRVWQCCHSPHAEAHRTRSWRRFNRQLPLSRTSDQT